MKCWAVQKILPLYIGGDFPYFQGKIKCHLENCSACQVVYQKYICSQQMLGQLKATSVPKDLFKGYWEEIYANIKPLQQVRQQPILNPFRLLASIAALILLCFVVFIPWQNEKTTTAASLPRPSYISKPIEIKFPKVKKSSGPVLLKTETQDSIEYELDQVKPLTTKDASF